MLRRASPRCARSNLRRSNERLDTGSCAPHWSDGDGHIHRSPEPEAQAPVAIVLRPLHGTPVCGADIRLFGDYADLTADLSAWRDCRVHVRIGSARLDRCDHRGQILRRQLLGGRRAGDDIG